MRSASITLPRRHSALSQPLTVPAWRGGTGEPRPRRAAPATGVVATRAPAHAKIGGAAFKLAPANWAAFARAPRHHGQDGRAAQFPPAGSSPTPPAWIGRGPMKTRGSPKPKQNKTHPAVGRARQGGHARGRGRPAGARGGGPGQLVLAGPQALHEGGHVFARERGERERAATKEKSEREGERERRRPCHFLLSRLPSDTRAASPSTRPPPP